MKKKILISTGGSGGHVIPAITIYDHLINDCEVYLSIDKRGEKYLNKKEYISTIIDLPKNNRNILSLISQSIKLFFLIIKSLSFIKKNKINYLISTGGYMSLPLCFAGKILKVKIYLFEPNMVLGRANNFFIRYCSKIFCYSDKIHNFPKKYINKIELIPPIFRKEFYHNRPLSLEIIKDEINLLIIGGSQGAQFFNDILKDTIITLSKKYKLKIYHQVKDDNKNHLKNFYDKNNIEYFLFGFDENIIKIIKNVNLCITRGGASTLSELNFLNIPSIVIPLPTAKDDHQFYNSLFYKKLNCCWILRQDEIKDDMLTKYLIKIINNKDDYLAKKINMKKYSYQNTWNIINKKLIRIINEN